MVDRDAIRRVTKELTDHGRLIEAGWMGLRMMSLPVDAPATQVDELRSTFFAGAHHVFQSLMTMLDPGEDPSIADLGRMASISAELEAFIADYEARHMPTGGSA